MIEVELPDGTIAEFPDGTQKGDIEKALRSKMQPAAQATQWQSFLTSPAGRVLRGLKDPIDAGAQMLSRLGGESEASRVDQMVREGATEYEEARKAAGQSGFDLPRTAGSIGLQMLALRGLPVPAAGASLGTRAALGAASGAGFGALQPVTHGDFWAEKAKQTAIGAGTGAVAAPLTELAAQVVKPTLAKGVDTLRAAGINPTIGQMKGGMFKTAEEKLASLPVVGSVIRSGQQRATQELNDAAWNRALSNIGKKLPQGVRGQDAVAFVDDAIGQNYDAILTRIGAVPVDRKLIGDLSSLGGLLQTLPKDRGQQYATIIKNEIVDRIAQNRLTGEALKSAESNIGTTARQYMRSADVDQQKLGEALFEAQRALREWLTRVAPGEAAALKANNRAYAEFLRPLRASTSLGVQDEAFTAAQLQNAVKALDPTKHKKAFAKGDALMQDLSQPAKDVLSPRVPNSGTTDRALASLLTLGAPTVAATAFGNPALYAAGLPALLYTGPGQKLAGAYFAGAPALREPVAEVVRRSVPFAGAGLFGLLGQE